ncbi:ABC transporter permease [Protofrankia symbiont of Coriaria ruscifolia]|uniref:ABC transporter permease n=1 Tax=Protofrankia symbiont of Coriaria ruscifolia TaxID=1306542 RepID=UPI001040E5DA|nr:ABC transporter permease [Protofrankia symbiont of Coriaria ruscifolia]
MKPNTIIDSAAASDGEKQVVAGRHRSTRSHHVTRSWAGPGKLERITPVTFLIDVYLLTRRLLMRMPHQPDLIVYSIVQPAIFTLAMIYLFGKAIALPGGANYTDFVIAGLLAQTVVMGAASATSGGIAFELSQKTIDRLRTLPLSRLSILAGCTNAGVIRAFITVFVTTVCGLVAGWRAQAGLGGALLAFLILLLFGLAMSWVGALIGVSVSNPEVAAGAGTVWLFPVMYLSNALTPVSAMPGWLQPVAGWNPLSAVTTACRQLFGNPTAFGVENIWPADHPILASVSWSLAIMLVTVPLTVWKFVRWTSR